MKRPLALLLSSCLALPACKSHGQSSPVPTEPALTEQPAASAEATAQAASATAEQPPAPPAITEPILDVVLRPQGRLLLRTAQRLIEWDPKSSAEPRSVDLHGNKHTRLLMHPNSPQFLLINPEEDGKFTLWDAETLTEVKTIDRPSKAALFGWGLSEDAQRFAAVFCSKQSDKMANCTLHMLATASGKPLWQAPLPGLALRAELFSLHFSSTGKHLLIAPPSNPMQVFVSDTGRRLLSGSIGFDGNWLMLPDDRLIVAHKDRQTLQHVTSHSEVRSRRIASGKESLHVVTAAPDASQIAVLIPGPNQSKVAFWRLADDSLQFNELPKLRGSSQILGWLSTTQLIVQSMPHIEEANKQPTRHVIHTESGTIETTTADPPRFERHGFLVYLDGIDPRRSGIQPPQHPVRVLLPSGKEIRVENFTPENSFDPFAQADEKQLVLSGNGVVIRIDQEGNQQRIGKQTN